jgi:hypothetical protein
MSKRLTRVGLLFLIIILQYNSGFGQIIDTVKNVLTSSILSDKFHQYEIKTDTSIEMFQIFKQPEKNSISSSNLGNIGTPDLSNIFIKRFDDYYDDFLFTIPYELYLIRPENVQFYNTRRPYTDIFYTTATKVKDEQTINFTHTQNVNPHLNLGFNYKLILSKGEYLFQTTRNNSLSLETNYQGDKYQVFGSFCFNKFKQQENGGIIDTGKVDISSLSTYLSTASSILASRSLFLTQKYRFGKYKSIKIKDSLRQVYEPLISVEHNITYDFQYRTYIDSKTGNYYENSYYYGATNDSAAFSNIENSVRIETEPKFNNRFKFGFSLTASNELKKYYNFRGYIRSNDIQKFSDNSLSASLFSDRNKKLQIDLNANYFLSGYRTGNYQAQANILKKFFVRKTRPELSISGEVERRSPSYFLQTYYSNHFRWNNDFDSQYNFKIKTEFSIPRWTLETGFVTEYIRNFISFGSDVMPTITKDQIQVLTAYISKNLKLGVWHSDNKIYWQKTTNSDVISIPEWSFFHSTYIEMNMKNKILKADIGFDIYYSTAFKAYDYNPAVCQFYLNSNSGTLIGDYPYGSVFINLLISGKVLMFFKFEHINSGFTKDLYFSTDHYPINSRMFKLGVRWTFPN